MNNDLQVYMISPRLVLLSQIVMVLYINITSKISWKSHMVIEYLY